VRSACSGRSGSARTKLPGHGRTSSGGRWCAPGRDKLAGEVEVDEGYLGGVAPGKHGRGAETKTPVLIAVEKRGRGMGRVRFARISDPSADSLLPALEDLIEPGSVVATDGHAGYNGVAGAGFTHDRHSLYATGDPAHVAMPRAHRVASLLKRWLLGTHQGAVRAAAARLLPRRVHLPLQPPRLQPPRPALLPAPRASRPGRTHAAREASRRRSDRPSLAPTVTKDTEGNSPLAQCPKSGGGGNRTRVRGRTGQSFYRFSSPFALARTAGV
jgi:transposase-like protein